MPTGQGRRASSLGGQGPALRPQGCRRLHLDWSSGRGLPEVATEASRVLTGVPQQCEQTLAPCTWNTSLWDAGLCQGHPLCFVERPLGRWPEATLAGEPHLSVRQPTGVTTWGAGGWSWPAALGRRTMRLRETESQGQLSGRGRCPEHGPLLFPRAHTPSPSGCFWLICGEINQRGGAPRCPAWSTRGWSSHQWPFQRPSCPKEENQGTCTD